MGYDSRSWDSARGPTYVFKIRLALNNFRRTGARSPSKMINTELLATGESRARRGQETRPRSEILRCLNVDKWKEELSEEEQLEKEAQLSWRPLRHEGWRGLTFAGRVHIFTRSFKLRGFFFLFLSFFFLKNESIMEGSQALWLKVGRSGEAELYPVRSFQAHLQQDPLKPWSGFPLKINKPDSSLLLRTDICWYLPFISQYQGGSKGKVWSRKWQPTPVFLPGKSQGQRSLADYSPWGCRVRHNWAHT